MTKTKIVDQYPLPDSADLRQSEATIIPKWRLLRPVSAGSDWARPQPGQALVEFALVLPVLMLIIVGIFEFGMAFFDASKVDFTTREVARRLAICANACDGSVTLISGTTSVSQFDLKDLDAIANQYDGPTNASSIDPSLIQYVWQQKIHADGYAIPVTGTVGSRSWDGSGSDFRQAFNYYVYNPNWKNDNSAEPFTVPLAAQCATLDPWVGNNEYNNVAGLTPYSSFQNCINWSSSLGSPIGSVGRRVCEPTNSFFVEIGYKHFWITPLIPSVNQQIMLKSRIRMKVEPLFFTNQFFGTGLPNPACVNN